MFTGIVEAKSRLIEFRADDQVHVQSATIIIEKPKAFDDIKPGDSICVNGACLTLEKFDSQTMQFSIGYETFAITKWTKERLESLPLNLERSLRYNDRIHGHILTGHVDGYALLTERENKVGSRILNFQVMPPDLASMIWKKGSVALNGVSLTVNHITKNVFSVCLIPETLERTNLGVLTVGDIVNIEVDQMARGLARLFEERSARELNS